jgi:sugar phosphate isomerase/epimerase
MQNVTRRGFVLGGAAAAAVAKVPLAVAQAGAAAKKAGVQLGLASYTFRKFDGAKLIEFCKTLHIDHVNLKDVHLPMGTPEEVKAKADGYRAAGLVITGGGTISFPKDEDADVKAKFEYAKAAGFPMIVAAPTHESVGRVAHFAAQYDIRVAIHNHGPEDKQFPSPLDVLKAVEKLDKRVGCCVDVGHCMRAGTDPVEGIRAAGARL